jgi:hypothetical protein
MEKEFDDMNLGDSFDISTPALDEWGMEEKMGTLDSKA